MRAGDNYFSISKRLYGTDKFAGVLARLNRGASLHAGMTIKTNVGSRRPVFGSAVSALFGLSPTGIEGEEFTREAAERIAGRAFGRLPFGVGKGAGQPIAPSDIPEGGFTPPGLTPEAISSAFESQIFEGLDFGQQVPTPAGGGPVGAVGPGGIPVSVPVGGPGKPAGAVGPTGRTQRQEGGRRLSPVLGETFDPNLLGKLLGEFVGEDVVEKLGTGGLGILGATTRDRLFGIDTPFDRSSLPTETPITQLVQGAQRANELQVERTERTVNAFSEAVASPDPTVFFQTIPIRVDMFDAQAIFESGGEQLSAYIGAQTGVFAEYETAEQLMIIGLGYKLVFDENTNQNFYFKAPVQTDTASSNYSGGGSSTEFFKSGATFFSPRGGGGGVVPQLSASGGVTYAPGLTQLRIDF